MHLKINQDLLKDMDSQKQIDMTSLKIQHSTSSTLIPYDF